MNMYLFKVVSLSFLFLLPLIVHAQVEQQDWLRSNDKSISLDESGNFQKSPDHYQSYEISINRFLSKLQEKSQEIEVPDPDGNFQTFVISPSFVNAPEVAHLYTIKTFTGYAKANPSIKIACDISSNGFNAAIYAVGKTYFVTPTSNVKPSKHISYYMSDLHVTKPRCHVQEIQSFIDKEVNKNANPTQKRTYRLAVSASGEYAQQFGGSPYNVTNVLNAIASGINMLNPVFLRDLGITFTNVTEPAIIFQNPNTDPYSAQGNEEWGGHTIDDQLIPTLANWGNQKFDVGHLVVWEDIGGLAGPSPCDNSSKAGGYSGATGSLSTLWIDFVAHEIGHQFGMPHNFSNSCDGNGEANFRYEPGEGSSIMAYATVCGIGYTQASDPFFAITSINAAQSHINAHTCPTTSSVGNSSAPVITQPGDITVPKETPFILVGSATDANDPDTNISYAWEQNDGDGPATTGAPSGMLQKEPLFRFRPATNQKYRHFPIFTSSLSGTNLSTWERPSSVARTINFSLTARDNNSSFGRVSQATNKVTVANTGPFNVTSPNGGESLGSTATVTWTVNGTDAHCSSVDILLSTDGGVSFVVIADATPNDGSQSVTFSSGSSSSARILVRCDVTGGFRAASTFYDVSNGNFSMMSSSNNNCNANETVTSATTTGNTLASAMITTQGSVQANSAVFSAPTVNINNGFCVPANGCFEVNNVGCAYTGTLNCGGGSSPEDGSCTSPFTLTCGTSFQGNTANGASTWSGYPSGNDYPGNETIHRLVVPANTSTTVTLTSTSDMDLFISSGVCDNMPEFSGEQAGDESVTISAQASSTTYFLVVDRYSGGNGTYTLSCN